MSERYFEYFELRIVVCLKNSIDGRNPYGKQIASPELTVSSRSSTSICADPCLINHRKKERGFSGLIDVGVNLVPSDIEPRISFTQP